MEQTVLGVGSGQPSMECSCHPDYILPALLVIVILMLWAKMKSDKTFI